MTSDEVPAWNYVIGYNRREYLQWCFHEGYDAYRPDWIFAYGAQWWRAHAEPDCRYMLTPRATQRRDWPAIEAELRCLDAVRVYPPGGGVYVLRDGSVNAVQFDGANTDVMVNLSARSSDSARVDVRNGDVVWVEPSRVVPMVTGDWVVMWGDGRMVLSSDQAFRAVFVPASDPEQVVRRGSAASFDPFDRDDPRLRSITEDDLAVLAGDPAPLTIVTSVEIEDPDTDDPDMD